MGGLVARAFQGYPMQAPGMVQAPNINLRNRPIVQNPDGSISTEQSMSFDDGRNEVIIPTIVEGHGVSEDAAIQHYMKTGKHMGKFKVGDIDHVEKFAYQTHLKQERRYGRASILGGN